MTLEGDEKKSFKGTFDSSAFDGAINANVISEINSTRLVMIIYF